MNPCEQWRQALTEHALGAPASATLTAHLEQCSACAQALRAMQLQLGRIDTGLQQLVAAEPSPDAPGQILAHIHASPATRSSAPHWWNPGRMAWAAAALILLALTAGVLQRLHTARTQEAATLSAAAAIANWQSPTRPLLRSPYVALDATSPRLGEYYYPLQTDPQTPHQPVPGKDRTTP